MRELTVRVRFTKDSLGNVKSKDSNAFLMPRSPQGRVTFLSSWHRANLRFASSLLGRHQDCVGDVCWDISVDGDVGPDGWHRRYYQSGEGRTRYALHEAFPAGSEVGIHCVVPAAISDDDFRNLLQAAGRYRGLSPYRPGEYGFFEVASIGPRKRSGDAREAGGFKT